MHAKQAISKSQFHIKLHYTWGDDISEKTCNNFGAYAFRRNNVEIVLAKEIFHES
jgi:hypothetical protein